MATLAGGLALLAGSAAAGTFPGANGKVAFVSRDALGFNQLFLMDPDGQNRTQLTFGDMPLARESSWSGDGQWLAFRGIDATDDEIFVIDANGQNLTQLTFNSVGDFSPSFSPDGQTIAFQSFVGGDFEIFVMDADGHGIVQLTDNAINDSSPNFSPSGQKIVFERGMEEGGGDIMLMDADGQNQTPVESGPEVDGDPSWSPDGRRILFARVSAMDVDIYVMDADGQNQTPLLTGPQIDQVAQFSPDGNQIVFMRDEGPGADDEIFVADANGQNATPLTDNSVADETPAWQPLNVPPACELTGEPKQKSPKQVSVTLTCPENATATVSGELKAPKPKLGAAGSKSKTVALQPVTLQVQPNAPTPVNLAPDKKGKKLLKKALKAGKKPKGTITAVATDAFGASASDGFAVKLKRKKG